MYENHICELRSEELNERWPVGDDHPSFKYVIVSKYFMLALKLFTIVFKRSDRSISLEWVNAMAIRLVGNTLSVSAEISLCRRPRLGRRENESAGRGGAGGGGGGTQSLFPSSTTCLLFLIYYFWPVVYPFSCREQYRLNSVMLGIHRPELAGWNSTWQKFCTRSFIRQQSDWRNLKLKTRQIRGGHGSYMTWRNFW